MSARAVLVTGATGYVGGRLVPALLEARYPVRCLVRDPARLRDRPWSERVEIASGDVFETESLAEPLAGIEAAYYLVRSLRGGAEVQQRELQAARNFGQAARAAGVQRIIYLGRLGDPMADRSHHIQSRRETGEALRESGLSVTEFRAGPIIGSGSISFESVRYLTERLPIMIGPRWVYTPVQPIAIRDVLAYLVAALSVPESTGRVAEIGGRDVLTYADMLLSYARIRGLRRLLIPVPLLTPRMSALWVHWMTPVPASIAERLIETLRSEVVVRDDIARQLFPSIKPRPYREAVELALARIEAGQVETIWTNALHTSQGDTPPVMLSSREGMLIEQRQRIVAASPETVYQMITGLGGERGWLYANWAWRLRGGLDRLCGGVGLRRGRRHPDKLWVGEALDFWRVEAAEAGRLLRLRAEMKLPGLAWLQFQALPRPDGTTLLRQTAYFDPKGVPGLAYWVSLYPPHALIFSGLIRELARRAEEERARVQVET